MTLYYVTTFVYKSHRLARKETHDNLLFLGPLFLHRDASDETYKVFFNHIASKLEADVSEVDLRIPSIMEFDTDDEKAHTKAIEHSFPDSTRVMRTKHLKDNLKHYLTNVAIVPRGERDIIQQLVFGENGLVNAEDTFHFEEISNNILATTANDKFKNYFVKLFKFRINLCF